MWKEELYHDYYKSFNFQKYTHTIIPEKTFD